eukprot:s4625_g2.t1
MGRRKNYKLPSGRRGAAQAKKWALKELLSMEKPGRLGCYALRLAKAMGELLEVKFELPNDGETVTVLTTASKRPLPARGCVGIPIQEESNPVDLEKDQVSDSSDSSSSSTSSDASASVMDAADVGPVDELIVARFTKVQHIMIETDDSHCPFWESRYFKAACGARLPRDDCVFDVQLRPQFSMCRHVACFKRWQQITALAD